MPVPTGVDPWPSQEAYIYDKIFALTQNGGPLAAFKNVEKIAPPEKGRFPCAGVMFTHFEEPPEATRQHQVICYYDIVVQLQSASDGQADTGARALEALAAYISVISPLFRTDPTLGGLAQTSRFSRFERVPLRTETGTAVTAVMAYWQLRTETPVRF